VLHCGCFDNVYQSPIRLQFRRIRHGFPEVGRFQK
jgi:hypothetical protein